MGSVTSGGSSASAASAPAGPSSKHVSAKLNKVSDPSFLAPIGMAAPEDDGACVGLAIDGYAGAALLHAERVAQHGDGHHRDLGRFHRVQAADDAPVGIDGRAFLRQ